MEILLVDSVTQVNERNVFSHRACDIVNKI